MKKVLIAEKHALFREFLKNKLSADQVEVIVSQGTRDLQTKMITNLPNLIILDFDNDYIEELEFLQKKSDDSNASLIPVIITGPNQDKSAIMGLTKYGVKKYFAKPIQFDIFFESIGKILGIPLSMDTTPCMLELHRNGNIIFIDLARGLNRDKIALLQFKLSEIIEKESIEYPRIVIMLTSLQLSFVDGYNLEFLIDNVRSCPKIHNKYIKILSLSPYLKELIDGHTEYNEIEIADNLPRLLKGIVETTASNANISDLITNRILTPSVTQNKNDADIDTRFSFETDDEQKAEGTMMDIAVIDSNDATLENTINIFTNAGAKCTGFKTGQEFLSAYSEGKFDLIILDIFISDKTGLSLLQRMKTKMNVPPIVIYSQNMTMEIMQKILALGARKIIIKPSKPEILVQKCLEVLD